jgi:hypothetical protein
MFLSPRLLIPSRLALPPVLYWRGTSPMEAAKSRAAAVLLAIAHLGSQHARRDRADARNRQQTLPEVVVGELPGHFLIDLTDLFAEVLEVGM